MKTARRPVPNHSWLALGVMIALGMVATALNHAAPQTDHPVQLGAQVRAARKLVSVLIDNKDLARAGAATCLWSHELAGRADYMPLVTISGFVLPARSVHRIHNDL
jgi:hypothetical protein